MVKPREALMVAVATVHLTSREPKDLSVFNNAIIKKLSKNITKKSRK